MHASRPIDHNVGLVFDESSSACYGSSGVGANIVIETDKDRIVLTNIDYIVFDKSEIHCSPLIGLFGKAAIRR